MFDLDNTLALESMLEDAVGEMVELEESLIESDPDAEVATEAFFSKPKSAEELVARSTKRISSKCKTVEDCDEYLAKINTEASKFNAALKTMKNAAIGLRDNKLDKAAASKQIKAARSEIKKSCDLISFGKIVANSNSVGDDDIKKLKDYITGVKAAVQARKKEIKAAGVEGKATEGFLAYVDGLLEDE